MTLFVDSPRRGPFLVVSIHEVAPSTTTHAQAWTTRLAAVGTPLTFLVVPALWGGRGFGDVDDAGEALAAWLRIRQALGDEISLHGWCHQANAPGRTLRRAMGSAASGLELLRRHNLAVHGFTPPGWLASRATRRGLADSGMAYLTSHAGLTDLRTGRHWRAPVLYHRPLRPPRQGRVLATLADAGLERLGGGMVRSAPMLVRAGRSVRIGLHPADLLRPGLAEASVRAIEGCLAAGATPVTYLDILRLLRTRR